MKNKIRIPLLLTAFIATAVLTYIFAIEKPVREVSNSNMLEAGLPIVYMMTDSGIKYNYLHGHVGNIDETGLRDVITPISSDREMSFYIKQYGCAISGVNYEVRTIDTTRLIEKTDINDYKTDTGLNGVTKASIKVKNLLEADIEYLLKINIKTEKYGDVAYYTRLTIMDDAKVNNKLAYALDFSNCEYDQELVNKLSHRITPDKKKNNNSDFGRVDIYSSLKQVGFDELQPQKVSDTIVSLNEIDGKYATITLNYIAKTGGSSETINYEMKETLRINQPEDDVTYVNNFDRWMNQIMETQKESANPISDKGYIYLGIQGDKNINVKNDATGDVMCFVNDKNLWVYMAGTGKLSRIFSFLQDGTDNLRERYDSFDIKIMSVNKEGNVRFMVYGYMNRGSHEGENGIAFFDYDSKSDITSEILFIPRKENYHMLKREIETLSYINDEGIIYIFLGKEIFRVDYKNKEYMVVASDINTDTCIYNDKSKVFAYGIGEDCYDISELNFLKLETGEVIKKNAGADNRMMLLGKIDENTVYGIAGKNMIKRQPDGVIFPMDKIVLCGQDNNESESYKEPGTYVTNAYFTDSKIVFERMKYDYSEGCWVKIDNDELLSSKKTTDEETKILTQTSQLRKTEVYLKPSSDSNKALLKVNEVTYNYIGNNDIILGTKEHELYKDYYYAYAYGTMYRMGRDLAGLINEVGPFGGQVADCNGKTLWTRYKKTSHTIKGADDYVFDLGNSTDISGCDINFALYFVGEDRPLYAKIGVDRYITITGYDADKVYGRVNDIENPVSIKISDMASHLAANGNYFKLAGE